MSTGATVRCALHGINVGVHDHQPSTSLLPDQTDSGVVVSVSVTDEEDLGVAILETKLFDTLPDRGQILRKIGIDEDISFRCANQINGQVGCPNIVEVARNLERWKWIVPVRVRLRDGWRH